MEHILIDLHNHIYPSGKKKTNNNLIKYFKSRNKTPEQKIFAITDHLQRINISEYKKEFEKIQKSIDKNIFLLPGVEINLNFGDKSLYKHLIIIFKNFNLFAKFFENCSEVRESLTIDNLFQNLKDINDYICIPHRNKSDKNRNFSKDEIIIFNKKFVNNPIYAVEAHADYGSWFWCSETLKNLGEPFNTIHTIVGTDRILEESKTIGKNKDIFLSPCSYIYTNSNITQVNAFDSILNFFKQSNTLSKLSRDINSDLTIQNANLDLKLLNSVICGKRGSGKSYLLESIQMSIGDDSYLLEQFEFADSSKTKAYLQKYLEKQKILDLLDCFKKIYSLIFNDKVNDIANCQTYLLTEIREYLKNFIVNVQDNVVNNLDNKSEKLLILKNHYNYQELKTNTQRVNKLKALIDKLIDLKQYLTNNEQDFNDLNYKNFLEQIKSFFSQLVMLYRKEYEKNKIYIKDNEIIKSLVNQGKLATNWKYNFNFSFSNYFYVKNIIDITLSFIKSKINDYYEDNLLYDNNDFLLKLNLKNAEFNTKDEIEFDTPIVTLANHTIASEGEKSEFLLLSKLEVSEKYLLLDEPEYSFDNDFICSSFTDQIIKKINNNKVFFIITHNHVLWSEVFDKASNKSLILCDRITHDNKYEYVYKQLINIDDKKEELISLFEATDDSYIIRRRYYGKK